MKTRAGERAKTRFRSNRIAFAQGCWHFVTRENTQEGPFATKTEALHALHYYIRIRNLTNQSIKTHINRLGLGRRSPR